MNISRTKQGRSVSGRGSPTVTSSHPFPLLRATRTAQIFVLEFSKDGLAYLGDKFADSGCGQPASYPARRCMSLLLCLSVIASFSPTSNGFLKLVTDFLMWWCMCSSMRGQKRAGGILAKFWYPGMSVCMRSSRRLL